MSKTPLFWLNVKVKLLICPKNVLNWILGPHLFSFLALWVITVRGFLLRSAGQSIFWEAIFYTRRISAPVERALQFCVFFFFFSPVVLHSIWGLSFLTRDQIRAPCFGIEAQNLNHWISGLQQFVFFDLLIISVFAIIDENIDVDKYAESRAYWEHMNWWGC